MVSCKTKDLFRGKGSRGDRSKSVCWPSSAAMPSMTAMNVLDASCGFSGGVRRLLIADFCPSRDSVSKVCQLSRCSSVIAKSMMVYGRRSMGI